MAAEAKFSSNQRTTVYYDGLCLLCSREITHYKKMKGSENINFIDITEPSFIARNQDLDIYQENLVKIVRTVKLI